MRLPYTRSSPPSVPVDVDTSLLDLTLVKSTPAPMLFIDSRVLDISDTPPPEPIPSSPPPPILKRPSDNMISLKSIEDTPDDDNVDMRLSIKAGKSKAVDEPMPKLVEYHPEGTTTAPPEPASDTPVDEAPPSKKRKHSSPRTLFLSNCIFVSY